MAKAKNAKRTEELTPIPEHKPRGRAGTGDKRPAADAPPSAPDLSQIAESLRPLAVPTVTLTLDPANVMLHPDANLEAIKGSLQAYGQRKPIVVNRRTGIVEAGNGTLQAALSLGWTRIAVVYVDDDPATAAGFSIADNRTAQLAEWDDEALEKLLREVDTKGDERLNAMFAELAAEQGFDGAAGNEGQCDPDEAPETPEEAVTKPGDLWILGNHRLLCGDSTKPEHVKRLMNGAVARMMFTDPPWNVAIGQDANPRHRQRPGLINDSLSPDAFRAFLDGFVAAFQPFVAGDVYCVLGASEWPTLDSALRDNGYHWSATIIWAKDTFVLGRSKYHRRYEPIWYGWHSAAKSSFGEARDLDDVWEIPRPKRSAEHPTMKPVELVARAVKNSSRPGDLVVDPFGGSGSTLIAVEQTGRKAFLMELDPLYCDVIVQRYEAFSGKKGKRRE